MKYSTTETFQDCENRKNRLLKFSKILKDIVITSSILGVESETVNLPADLEVWYTWLSNQIGAAKIDTGSSVSITLKFV